MAGGSPLGGKRIDIGDVVPDFDVVLMVVEIVFPGEAPRILHGDRITKGSTRPIFEDPDATLGISDLPDLVVIAIGSPGIDVLVFHGQKRVVRVVQDGKQLVVAVVGVIPAG